MTKETEVKFKVEKKDVITSKLRKSNFGREDMYHERNIIFDKDGEMKETDRLIRFRKIKNSLSKEIFTYKGPRENNGKTREEIEFETDVKKLMSIFKKLGYSPEFKYEKRREVWRKGNVKIVIDELPFLKTFMEIEGAEKDIERTARKLELSMDRAITDTYMELFERYRKENDVDEDFLVWDSFTIEDL